MCRHLGYLGPLRGVGDVLTAGSHSLRVQSYAPKDMRGGGTINADGFGAAWWGRGGVSSYRNAMPIWSDPAVDDVLAGVESTAVVAAVRSATVGMPVERSACAPFTDDTWAFSHNGVVFGFPEVLVELASEVPTLDLLTLPAPTDSAALWVILRHLLRDHEPEKALRELASRVQAASPKPRLNLLLGDGRTLYATTMYHSLAVLDTGDSVTVASEPLDDNPAWTPIGDHQFVCARPGHIDITDL
ncbi:ergothioneine biosynthesis protein EgtC [Rhodococcus sp. BP-252]|uniref:Gamma-glutamyl-hercynylcysteine sulfoxide hydrolase n=1 Tax=Rhodococcoides kyotonense TaxID=398843 RepID=A0A177YJC3_9NOCA|nr:MULTISPECIES: ergothioneine biosynthesis protein EgtC [Rhodococcus]MBY6414742.1 ergothioneine biosynthesis protein EgtC [Rhodococcus sp. BP-320]MBY6419646.1 ergothioneine biosynthesis protein EgtC [Rhodococcus sp. BP-321]MBY6424634.1 ergothioneine biosynthesis protein EgtC [Rhodococcus sp. BP-324]MBY6429631.1 ergothioneine biosynthesis protein EgtC [Rhodococcus sp. BP-323]MBY6434592.1 ergothioneine biosynthesis protein EgtC [Rhodococcus sp. BP-322]